MVACLGLTKPMCKNVIDQACVGGGGLKNNLLWGVLPPFFLFCLILFLFWFVLLILFCVLMLVYLNKPNTTLMKWQTY